MGADGVDGDDGDRRTASCATSADPGLVFISINDRQAQDNLPRESRAGVLAASAPASGGLAALPSQHCAGDTSAPPAAWGCDFGSRE